ncbi:hypothetical protein [Spirosoma sp. KNUC1025]|nr:hypothetical protein LN737_01230 [Spirosoma sp. KNUC1025]
MSLRILHNPYGLPANARVVEWRGRVPYRIYLECGLMLRLSSTGLYVPEP